MSKNYLVEKFVKVNASEQLDILVAVLVGQHLYSLLVSEQFVEVHLIIHKNNDDYIL